MKRIINIATILLMLFALFITVSNAQTAAIGSTIVPMSVEERSDGILFYWEGVTLDSGATIWSDNLDGIEKYLKEYCTSVYKGDSVWVHLWRWTPAYYSYIPVKTAGTDTLATRIEFWNNMFYDGENTAGKWKVRDTVVTYNVATTTATPAVVSAKIEFANTNNPTVGYFNRFKVINTTASKGHTFNFSIFFQKREFIK